MIVTVKNMHQITHEFDVDINISLIDLHKLVCEKFVYDNARLIYAGRMMNLKDNLSQYMKETDRGFIVVMKVNSNTNTYTPTPTIPTPTISTPTISTPTIPTPTIPTPTIPTIPTPTIPTISTSQIINNNEPTYNVRQVRATLIGLLRFISTNQLLNYTYFTSPDDFYHIMHSDTFVDVIQQILNSSTEIANTLDNNENMNIEIVHPVTQVTSTNNQVINTNNQVIGEQPTEFTEEDINNIQTLVSFGYTEQQATIVYIMAHKNLNLAASLLLDL